MKFLFILFFFCLISKIFSVRHIDLWHFVDLNLNNPQNTTILNFNEALSAAYFKYQVPLDGEFNSPTSNVSRDDSYGLELLYRYGGSYVFSGSPPVEVNSGSSSIRLSKKIPFLFGQDLSLSYSEFFNEKDILPSIKNHKFSTLSISGQLPFLPSKIQYLVYQKNRLLRDYELARINYVSQIENYIRTLVDEYFEFSIVNKQEKYSKNLLDDKKILFESLKIKYEQGKVSGLDYLTGYSDYLVAYSHYLKEQHNYSSLLIDQEKKEVDVYQYLDVKDGEILIFDEIVDFVIDLKSLEYYLSRLEYNKDFIVLLFDLERIEQEQKNVLGSILDDVSFAYSKPLETENKNQENFSLNFSFSLPILDQGQRQKRIQNTHEQFQTQILKIRDFITTYRSEMSLLYNDILSLKAANTHMELMLEIAEKRYVASLERYKTGDINYLDLEKSVDMYKQIHRDVLNHQKSLFLNYYDLLCKSGLFVVTEDFMKIKKRKGYE